MQSISKLSFLLLFATLLFGCNFERNGDQSEVDEDMFSGAEYGSDIENNDDIDDGTEGDPLLSGSGNELDGDVDGNGTVEWTEQSARSAVTANSADYDSSGIKRYDTSKLDEKKIEYLRTPESFSTNKNLTSTTNITPGRDVKPNPLGRDKDYDGPYEGFDADEQRRKIEKKGGN